MNRSTGWIVLVWAMCGSFGCTTQPATAPKESATDQGLNLVGDRKLPDDAEPTTSNVEEDEDEKVWPAYASGPPRFGDEQVAVAERPLYNSLWDRNAGIAHLGRLKHLKKLTLFGSKLTDESLNHVSQLDSLQDLWIRSSNGGNGPSPKFTAAGYAHLARMKHLRLLCLKDVDINPAVPTLCAMTWLETLFLDESSLSQQSLRQLWDSPLRRKTNGKGGLPDPDLPREAR